MAKVGRGRGGRGEGRGNINDSDEEVEAVDVGGPSEPFGLDLNKLIEVEKYKTPPRKSPRRKIHMEQPPQQKLTPRTAATTFLNVSGRKAAQKRKVPDYEPEENMLRGLEGIAQIFLKMEESRLQTMLKLEADRADREFAMMKLKLETQEWIAKEKRESDERIAVQNISFQLILSHIYIK
jgi:hypothetical protein